MMWMTQLLSWQAFTFPPTSSSRAQSCDAGSREGLDEDSQSGLTMEMALLTTLTIQILYLCRFTMGHRFRRCSTTYSANFRVV